jgi:hypothetical protein
MPHSTIRQLVALGMLVSFIGANCPASLGRQASQKAEASAGGACALLTPAEIAKVTGLTVGKGAVGTPIPGVLGKCTWSSGDNQRVIVTLADQRHMLLAVEAQEQTGGSAVPGLGSRAVGMQGAAFTGGGYIVSVLDAKGGFGVSILGHNGNRERAIALAKLVESRR